MIAVVDYGIGNIGSVANTINKLGFKFRITGDPEIIGKSKIIILPGVGSAAAGMANLKKLNLAETITDQLRNRKPFLGICLGMQLLFDYSEEGKVECLGFIKGKVLKFKKMKKVPHIGWNRVSFKSNGFKYSQGFKANSYFYFVNSYYCEPADKSIVAGTTDYGESFASVIIRNNLLATQFHPEKSGITGLYLLNNFFKHYL
ncbi:MAG: imidazole glycerol phosphate synthase, glutamine amidotransferase subunit, glutamine amidotransferase [Candidatus Gottesmanbacteria bacterium GW2011_GWA2_43_14]|uniref:Imidazole glycerol phosphate synthase subunit HisH n=1 Tax=Candidatus Gottesmanbacteria bacterium GW2011_GWA2_43_14 TaxID=1618443 RepID=A0A0G1FNT6_9BACT|nr:MAG: imidazole glycerol phosphate synthase, glutamine amidotransferase subunit, glutamine amidotransferase [Candidatus Gottesmanbacteria bacterium GW2011_GWA2_43_14]